MFLSLRKFVMLGKVSKVMFFERFGLMQSWHQTNSAARFKQKTGARFCLTTQSIYFFC